MNDIFRVDWSDGTSTYFIGVGTKEEIMEALQGFEDKTPILITEDTLEVEVASK